LSGRKCSPKYNKGHSLPVLRGSFTAEAFGKKWMEEGKASCLLQVGMPYLPISVKGFR
jgi:hypothetical protein